MNSKAYRVVISTMSYKIIKRQFPGLEKTKLRAVSVEIARNIHARMYGANVDGVDSPIWQDKNHCQPRPLREAAQLLKESENEKIICNCRIACYSCYGAK